MNIRLSKSALDNFVRCPRCFHLEKVEGIKQPGGIRSGLPMAMDRVLKAHHDEHRSAGTVPLEWAAALPGWKLYDGKRISMADLRNWRKGLAVDIEGVTLSTALDEMLFNQTLGLWSMADYKTKAKATDKEDTQKYYGTQASAYDLALNINGYKTDGSARFLYYFPEDVDTSEDGSIPSPDENGSSLTMGWRCQVITIKADHDRIKKLVLSAAACLSGPLPEPNYKITVGKKGGQTIDGCEMCAYIFEREKVLKSLAEVKV